MPLQVLNDHLSHHHAGPPQQLDGLTVFPLFVERPRFDFDFPPLEFTTLAAKDSGEPVEVREVSESGRVPNLIVENGSPRYAFLLDGEELLGGKQARVVNSSFLLAPHSTSTIAVSCCEAGRWNRQRNGFGSEHRSMPSSLKAQKVTRLSRNLREGRGHDADQSAVWRDIADYSSLRGVQSRTSAMGDVFAADQQQIGAMVDRAEVSPGQVGIVAVAGNRLLSVELFASPELYQQVHKRLMHSFATEVSIRRRRGGGRRSMGISRQQFQRERRVQAVLERHEVPASVIREVLDASQPGPNVTGASALRFVGKVFAGELTTHETAGLGTDVRVTARGGQAAALVHDGQLIHLSAFPN